MAEFDINKLEWSAIKDDQKKIDLVVSWFSQYYAEDAKALEYPLTESGLNYIKAVVSGGIQEEDTTESNETINNEHDVTEEEYYAQIAATEEEYVAEREANMTAENMTQETVNETINNKMEDDTMNKENGMKRNIEEAINNAKAKLENSKLMNNIKTVVLSDPKTRKKFCEWAKKHGNDTVRMSKAINENPWQIFDFLMERGAELTAYYKEFEDVLEGKEVTEWDAIRGITTVIRDTMATENGKINKAVGIAKDIAKYLVFLFVQVLCVFCKIIKIAWSCVKTVGFFIGTYTLKIVKGIFHLICKAVNWVKDKINGVTYTIDDLDDDDFDDEYTFEEE